MSTTPDYNIANQSGSSFLLDLNTILDALRSSGSDNSPPIVFSDYQLWTDTSTNTLKLKTPSGNVDVCNINTGLFSEVEATTTATTMDTYTTSTDASITNRIIRRDNTGSITGDLTTGSISGNASGLGSLTNNSSFLFNGNNLTGTLPNETTSGDLASSTIRLTGTTSTAAIANAQEIRFKPFRKGGWRASLRTIENVGDIVLWASHTPAAKTTWTGAGGDSLFTADFILNDGDYMIIEVLNATKTISSFLNFSSTSSGWQAPNQTNIGNGGEVFGLLPPGVF